MLHVAVMAGGAGARFWPASRADRPKQLLDFGGGRTMLQMAVDRLGDLVDAHTSLRVITNERLIEPIRAQLPDIPAANVIGEPCKRDTAPAVGLAAAFALASDPDATLLVTPADHVISTDEAFRAAVRRAVALVEADARRIATFGIAPTYPAATYGYIERGDQQLDSAAPAAWTVARFREKPSVAVATEYLASGRFFWNAGIFVWKARTVWDALARHEPAMFAHLEKIAAAIGRPEFDGVFREQFAAIQGKSIDYAVLERHPQVVVVEAPFAWDDLGNWPSLARTQGADTDGNTIVGRHLGVRTSDCVVRSEGNHLVATLGVKNLIVVHTPDATLIADRNDEESVREIVRLLGERGWTELL